MGRNTFETIDLLSDGVSMAWRVLFMIYRDMPDRWPGVVLGLVEREYIGLMISNLFYMHCETSIIKFCELVELPDKKAVELYRLDRKHKEEKFRKIKALFEKSFP